MTEPRPDVGTLLNATYKRRTYKCEVIQGGYRLEDGRIFRSPSGAAGAITGTSVNGRKFWSVVVPEPPTPPRDRQHEQFLEHIERSRPSFTDDLSEAGTRKYLIDPVLEILGFSRPADLRLEVPIPATKEFMDYVLLAGGKPVAIVEAKSVKLTNLEAGAGKCVQYAVVLGVRWCVITNGVRWAIYDAHNRKALAEMKVTVAYLDGGAQATDRAWQVLLAFSRERLVNGDGPQSLVVERAIYDELIGPSSATLTALRKSVKERTNQHVPTANLAEMVSRLGFMEDMRG